MSGYLVFLFILAVSLTSGLTVFIIHRRANWFLIRKLFSHSSLGFIVMNPEKVFFINPAAKRMLGLPKEGLLTEVIIEKLSKQGNSKWTAESLFDSAEPSQETVLEINTKDGKQYYQVCIDRILGKNKITVVLTDITQKMSMQSRMLQLKEEAERANEYKGLFLASMSHEIRTPLNAIIGFTEILHRKIDDPEYKEYLSVVLRSSKTLLDLISDILDLSKLESGTLSLECHPVDPTRIFQEIESTFQIPSREKGIPLHYSLPSNLPSFLWLDEKRIKQVLMNLIGNALKFTHEGYIRVECHLIEREKGYCDLRIHVEDTGIGIEKEAQGIIFEAFTQQPGQDHRLYGGTGLGLSITKGIVRMLGGTIGVESSSAGGTVFTVLLPQVKTSIPTRIPREEDPDTPVLFNHPFMIFYGCLKETHSEREKELLDFQIRSRFIEKEESLPFVLKRFRPDIILIQGEIDPYPTPENLRTLKEQHPYIPLILVVPEEQLPHYRETAEGVIPAPLTRDKLIMTLKTLLPYKQATPLNPLHALRELSRQEKQRLSTFLGASFYPLVDLSEGGIIIENFREAAQTVIRFGEDNKLGNLANWGHRFLQAVETFSISEIRKELEEIKELFPFSPSPKEKNHAE